jgi:hypothetical protein
MVHLNLNLRLVPGIEWGNECPMKKVSSNLIEDLRSTLLRVEKELSPDDPALIEYRRAVLRLITDLEIGKTQEVA